MGTFGSFVLLIGVTLTWSYLNPPRSSFDSDYHLQQLRAQLFAKDQGPTRHAEIVRAPRFTQAPAGAEGPTNELAYKNTASLSQVSHVLRDGTREAISFKAARSRYQLAGEIQKQLKSRGCYWGRVDGSWGAGSKYAMRKFLTRVNAKLPSGDPHHTLLTLLQASGDMTCGGCPEGKRLTPGGSCMTPSEFIEAKSLAGEKPSNKLSVSDEVSDRDVRVGSLLQLPGRMSIGSPPQLPSALVADDSAPLGAAGNLGLDQAAEGRVSNVSRASASRTKSATARKARHRQAKKSDPIRRNLMLSLGGVY